MDPLTVLLNAHAGLSRPSPEAGLAQALAEQGVRAVIELVEPARLQERIQQLAGRPLLGVAGGDGTQRTAARTLAGSGTALAPFPTGRLNHFARRLGLDTVERAARSVREGRIRPVAVGMANDHVFVNTAVAGAYPAMVRVRERIRPFLTHWPAAAAASLYGLLRWRLIDVELRMSGTSEHRRTAMVWVGIGAGSFPSPHEAPVPPADGSLEIVILPDTGRRAALTLLGSALRHRLGGKGGAARGLEVTRATWLELAGDGPIPTALDGEPHLLSPPLCIRFRPDALRVIAPAG